MPAKRCCRASIRIAPSTAGRLRFLGGGTFGLAELFGPSGSHAWPYRRCGAIHGTGFDGAQHGGEPVGPACRAGTERACQHVAGRRADRRADCRISRSGALCPSAAAATAMTRQTGPFAPPPSCARRMHAFAMLPPRRVTTEQHALGGDFQGRFRGHGRCGMDNA